MEREGSICESQMKKTAKFLCFVSLHSYREYIDDKTTHNNEVFLIKTCFSERISYFIEKGVYITMILWSVDTHAKQFLFSNC